MFDSVGKNLDEEATKRSAQSALIVSVVSALVGGVVFVGAAYTVKEVVLDQPLDEEIMEVALDEQPEDLAAPPPPPPPPPSAAPATEEEEETPKTPDEMVEDVKKLDENIKQEMKSDIKPAGQEGGVEGGVAGGVVGGVAGGVVGGVVGGQLGAGGGPRVVHYSQVEVKKRVDPEYPAAAKGLGLGEQKCKVTVDIDTEGVPTRVNVEGCPKVFVPETEQAIYKWRWYPFKAEGGAKAAAQFTIIVKYRETS